jgi:type I restriction enzyme S subunit
MLTPRLAALGGVADFVMGQAPPSIDCNFEHRGTIFVKAGEFGEQFPIVREWTTKPLKLARRGDVLVCVVGATAGKVNMAFDCAIGRSVAAIRPSSAELDTKYLFHFLTKETFFLRQQSQGAAQAVLTREMLGNLILPLPCLSEQRRIAAILDQADALRAKRRQTLAQLDEMARAIFVDMFGCADEQSPWPVEQLGQLCELVRGSSPRPQGDPKFFGGPVPRLMIADITRDGVFVTPKIDSLTLEGAKRSRPMPAGSVVMAVSGAVGLPAILSIDACIHDGFVGFRALKLTIKPLFLYYYLKQHRTQNRAQGTGAIWINLTTDQVSRFGIPMPPISLQQTFLDRIQAVDKLIGMHHRAEQRLDHLFSSLQHRAFRGEL